MNEKQIDEYHVKIHLNNDTTVSFDINKRGLDGMLKSLEKESVLFIGNSVIPYESISVVEYEKTEGVKK